MAKDLNKVMLIGRLGQDPEIRYTQDGTPVTTLSVATSSPVKKGDSWDEETEWHRVVAWRRLAEIANEYMNKGTLVYVEGRLKTRSWEDRDGNKRWTTEIVARDIFMLGGRGETNVYQNQDGGELAPPEHREETGHAQNSGEVSQSKPAADPEPDVPF